MSDAVDTADAIHAQRARNRDQCEDCGSAVHYDSAEPGGPLVAVCPECGQGVETR
jgi:membrane protease subunit (stomatin/prohibitin family)